MRAGPGTQLLVFFLCCCLFSVSIPAGGLNWPRQNVRRGVELDGVPVQNLTPRELDTLVRQLAVELAQPPRSAYIDPQSGEIVPEMPGWQLDVPLTVKRIMDAPANRRVLPVLIQLDPEITAAHFNSIREEIGVFRTWIGGGGNRAANIILATISLNNYLLLPGETFSFNAATGPRTAERGYRPAPVIVGHTVVPGLGGGICQVSTTLYNSVLQAGLEVVERYPHSQPIGYVPPGMDATIADTLDFRFRNNSDRLIMIRATNPGGSIDVRIWQD